MYLVKELGHMLLWNKFAENWSPFVTPIADVKQRAKVHGPLVLDLPVVLAQLRGLAAQQSGMWFKIDDIKWKIQKDATWKAMSLSKVKYRKISGLFDKNVTDKVIMWFNSRSLRQTIETSIEKKKKKERKVTPLIFSFRAYSNLHTHNVAIII